MVERFVRWLLFRPFPRLRSMLSEIAGLNPARQQTVAYYATARAWVWRDIAMEVLYGRNYRDA